MLEPFAEGVRSIEQVCHLVVLAPVAVAMAAARAHVAAIAGAIFGVVVGGWIFVANWFGVNDLQLRLSAIAVIIAIIALAVPAVVGDQTPPRVHGVLDTSAARAGLTAGVGIVVTQWWRPCVGEELGSILTQAPGSPIGQLPATISFMLGISTPLLVIGLIVAVVRPNDRAARRASLVAAALGFVLAGSVVAGQHGEIVARLFQWSQ